MTGRRITLAGTPRPTVRARRIFRGQAREEMVRTVMGLLRRWQLSPFEYEGRVRAGLRSALCLKGHAWHKADHEAAKIVGEGLRLLGAVRPSWLEGQPQYPLGRDYCWTCRGPLDQEARASRRAFCCDECRRSALTHRMALVTVADNAVYFASRYAAMKEGLPERVCHWCGTTYKPTHLDQKFCSYVCSGRSSAGENLVKQKPCMHCGEPFRGRHQKAKFCSAECRVGYIKAHGPLARLPERHCDFCKAVFRPGSAAARYCSATCKTASRAAMDRTAKEARRRENGQSKKCGWCDGVFKPRNANHDYCSKPCRERAWHQRARDRAA